MPPKRDILQNPIVSEFVYDCLMKATLEQKKNLNGKLLRATRTSRTAKAFAMKSTQEEKAILLAKLGVSFSWNFNLSKKRLMELFENRKTMTPTQLTDLMLREKIVIVTDKQVVQFLGVMAANCHSEIYLLNRDFLKAGYMAREFRKEYFSTTLSELKTANLSAKWMARTMVNNIVSGKFCEALFDMPETSICVLLFMFSKDKEFITEQEIRLYFNGIYRGFKLGKSINDLLKVNFIEKSYLTESKEYCVTKSGIEAVLRFEKRTFSMEYL